MQPPLISPPRSRPSFLLLLLGAFGPGLWPGIALAQGIGQPAQPIQIVPGPRDRGTPSQTFGGGTRLIPNPRDRGTPTNTRSGSPAGGSSTGGSPTGGVPEDAGIGPEDVDPSRPRLIRPTLVVPVSPEDPSPPEDAISCEALEPPFVNLSPNPDAPGGPVLEVLATNPILHAHLPQGRPAIAEWAIFDHTGTLLEVQQLPLSSDVEQISFRAFTEASGQGLEPQKSYRWSLVLGCDAQDPSRNPGVLGELQRTPIAPSPRRSPGHPRRDRPHLHPR